VKDNLLESGALVDLDEGDEGQQLVAEGRHLPAVRGHHAVLLHEPLDDGVQELWLEH